MAKAVKGKQAFLRHGRWSMADAEYFLTFCTDARDAELGLNKVATGILNEAHRLETESIWTLRTAVVMPDHVHLLVRLGRETDLAQSVRLMKGRTAPLLRTARVHWQSGYFDHRLRREEEVGPIFRYIFLNPYRAGLVSLDTPWHGYYCATEDWMWFEGLTNVACPFPEWLDR